MSTPELSALAREYEQWAATLTRDPRSRRDADGVDHISHHGTEGIELISDVRDNAIVHQQLRTRDVVVVSVAEENRLELTRNPGAAAGYGDRALYEAVAMLLRRSAVRDRYTQFLLQEVSAHLPAGPVEQDGERTTVTGMAAKEVAELESKTVISDPSLRPHMERTRVEAVHFEKTNTDPVPAASRRRMLVLLVGLSAACLLATGLIWWLK